MCKEHQQHRPGATLHDQQAHQQDHQNWSRRDFLSATGLLGAGGLLMGNFSLRAFQPTPLLAALSAGGEDRILVLIRLDGGNDGLNTVIERGNSFYYNNRPTIAVTEPNMWALNDSYGMPASTADLQPLWLDGMMKVMLNVGYPEPNYSHFRSYDIVASASDSEQIVNTGWLGRFLDNEYPAFLAAAPTVPPALQIGVQANLVFKADQANMALAVSSPQEFYQIAQTGQLYDVAGLGNTPREIELAYVRQTANSAFRYAGSIKDAYNVGKNDVTYPADNYLAEQMAIVARLIKGRLGTKIFMVEIGGFDTHANQADTHPILMNQIATSVKAFYEDLAAGGDDWSDKVLGLTFSEFGRTIFENGSVGTDHGWGTHSLMFGKGIGQDIIGEYQDMSNPDPYVDPPFSLDFRDIYATVLQDWLGAAPEVVNFVLGNDWPRINGLVPAVTPALGDNGKCALLGHNPSPDQVGSIEIKYAMMRPGPVRLQLLDSSGHVLRNLVSDFRERGSYVFNFKAQDWFLPPGEYQYRLQSGGQVFQRPLRIG
jgi:uncharacterized protein (DUF1501 family)